MKVIKIISGIIYFLFTFIFGIILALYLPNVYAIRMAVDIMSESFESGDYKTAISMAGGLYDEDYAFQTSFSEGGGIVLFKMASLISSEIDGKEVENSKLHKAYTGFVYGVKNIYNINSNDGNKTEVVVTDSNGNTYPISIIDYDSDGDKVYNTIYTYEEKGYFYLDIGQDLVTNIAKITLIDKDGNTFAEVAVTLDYSEQFFTDVEPLINEYNTDFKSENLQSLRTELFEKSEKYKQCGTELAKSKADKKATAVVVVYFIVIYVIADLLFTRYIIKFVKWILVKVFKVQFKQKGPKNTEVFGHDYYCKLSLSVDITEVKGFDGSVQVRFQNAEGEEFTYILLRERNYTDTQSIKAGNYVNLWVDLDTKYKTQNLPDTLEVEGYQKTITFKILNRED